MSILDTPRGRDWLSQFAIIDRPAAKLLADSVQLASQRDLEMGIKRTIERIRTPRKSVALFAVREIDIPPMSPDFEQYALDFAIHRGKPFYFPLRDNTIGPQPVEGRGVGSEGTIAGLIRDLVLRLKRGLADHPSLVSMRDTKCRQIIIVDDLIGSGSRALSFIEAFRNNKTIRSWGSSGYIPIHLVVHAASVVGLEELKSIKNLFVHYTRLLERGSRRWSAQEKRSVIKICEDYSTMTSRPSMALGYKGGFSCIAFEHKCPNTAPAILWAGSQKWHALFSNRPRLDGENWQELQEDRIVTEKAALSSLRQPRLADAWSDDLDEHARLLLLTIAACARKIRHPNEISNLLCIDVEIADRLLDECSAAGWVSWKRLITENGRKELDYARERHLLCDQTIELRKDFYIPKALRGQRSN